MVWKQAVRNAVATKRRSFFGAAGAMVEAHADGFVLVSGAEEGGNKISSRIYFDRVTLLPFRRELYASSGRLFKTVHIDETRDWQGVQIPRAVRFADHLRQGAEVRIEILEAREIEGDLDELFSEDRLLPVADDSRERP